MRGCRKLTQEEINTKLENHKLWLEDNARGEQADFSNVDFTGVNLTNTKGAIIDGKTLKSDHLQEQTDEVIA